MVIKYLDTTHTVFKRFKYLVFFLLPFFILRIFKSLLPPSSPQFLVTTYLLSFCKFNFVWILHINNCTYAIQNCLSNEVTQQKFNFWLRFLEIFKLQFYVFFIVFERKVFEIHLRVLMYSHCSVAFSRSFFFSSLPSLATSWPFSSTPATNIHTYECAYTLTHTHICTYADFHCLKRILGFIIHNESFLN